MALVQYIFLRTDLKKFSKGAVITQACHSAMKAIHIFRQSRDTVEYLSNVDSMHKVILKITEEDIKTLVLELEDNKIDFIIWVEQPEGIITSIALRPYKKDKLKEILICLSQFKLW